MITDRALDILAMSEQACWREGIEPEDKRKAIETIREALQSKPSVDVLDKIRAEIEDLDRFYDNDYFSGNRDSMFKCNEVMQIIDKYKAEREDEE